MPRQARPWFRASKNSWYITLNGKKVSLGVTGRERKSDALKAWHRLLAEPPGETEGEHLLEPLVVVVPGVTTEQPSTPRETLPALVTAFLTDCSARLKPESLRGYRKYLVPFSAAFKSVEPKNLTPTAVDRWSRKPGWSQSYRAGFIGTVISLFRWAVDTGRLTHNPVAGIKKPAKQSRGRKAVITAEDHARLLQHADPLFRDFLELLWLTGARPGEIAGLTADRVDVTSRAVSLSEHKTAEQTGRDRIILLCDEAVVILGGLIRERPTGLLFPGDKGQLLSPNNVSCRMRRLCKRAGVQASCYGYRHTFATDALANGVPDAQVAELLGHSGTAMLHKHYAHLTARTKVLREALGRVR